MSVADIHTLCCNYCGNPIGESDDRAGNYVTRNGGKVVLHDNGYCAGHWDMENVTILYCVDCGEVQPGCDERCPKGMGGIHTFAEVDE